jgi:signal transduction histidine kinase
LRSAVYDLRLGSIKDRPLLHSVESLIQLNRQMVPERVLELVVEEGFPEELPGDACDELLRIIQEALANVRRHSGASHARITLGREGDDLRMEIEDDGLGFEPESGTGIGLTGMRERANALDGELEIESKPGEGTRVRFRVALSKLPKASSPKN